MRVRRDLRVGGDVKHDRVQARARRITLQYNSTDGYFPRGSDAALDGVGEYELSRRDSPLCGHTWRTTQEIADQRDSKCRVFLHDPVTGIGNDGFSDVDGDVAHVGRHEPAKRFLGADGQ